MHLLGTSATREPRFAPGDTARVRAVSVSRQRFCEFPPSGNGPMRGVMTAMDYYIEVEVAERQRYITVILDPVTLTGGVSVVHEGRFLGMANR